jgi:hypothetical protein
MQPKHLIHHGDLLLRRFPITNPDFYKVIDGKIEPTSAAFKTKPHENGLSVNLKKITGDIRVFQKDPDTFKVAEFDAAIPLDEGFECEHDPCPPEEPTNYGHSLIKGNTKKIAKKISKKCTVL